MKKYIALLLALLMLMGTAPAAFAVPAPADQSLADQPAENLPAADHPVLPNGHPESRRGEIPQPKIVQPLPEAEIQAASALDVTVEQTGELPRTCNLEGYGQRNGGLYLSIRCSSSHRREW